MTTLTFNTYNLDGSAITFGETSIIIPDNETDLRVEYNEPQDAFYFATPNLGMLFDGQPAGPNTEFQMVNIGWDSNTKQTTFLIVYPNGLFTSEVIFIPLGGDPLPEINTTLDLGNWLGSLGGFSEANTGPFQLGVDFDATTTIAFDSLTQDDEVVFTNNGPTFINTGSGHDTITIGEFGRVIDAGAGNDSVFGGSGKDTINGGDGNDEIFGNANADKLFGNAGADFIAGGGGDDTLKGQSDNDDLKGNGGNDRIFGNGGTDKLLGNGGADKLFGGGGNDKLYGGAGGDTLNGDAGNDVLKGGGGADVFIFTAGKDRIVDFNASDALQIEADLLTETNPQLADLVNYASLVGGNLVLDFGGGDTLKFIGVDDVVDILGDVSFI